MKTYSTLDEFNRIVIPRAAREAAGIKKREKLCITTMPLKIIIEADRPSGRLVKKNGRTVWTGELPEGSNSAMAIQSLRDEI